MAENKICITTDCVCDLPDEILKKNNVDLIYFYIETDSGRFRDIDEITAQNVFDYLENGGVKTVTEAPPSNEFIGFFKEKLKSYDDIIHICISSKISKSFSNAIQAVEEMGEKNRIYVIDSLHLSTGIGHMVLRAAEMVRSGCCAENIIAEMEDMRSRVSTSFITDNTDFLYLNGQVSKAVHKICTIFKIHPVISMQDGFLKLKSIYVGNYKRSAAKYVRAELKSINRIKSNRLFITHAGCSTSDVKMIKKYVSNLMTFDEVIVTMASATISSNSGPRTFGLLYIKER